MLAKLRKNRIAIKYILLTAVLLAALTWLSAHNVFSGVEKDVNRALDTLSNYGLIGMFIIGLFSNTTLVIQIPYNLPMFTLVIYAHSIWDVLALGAATGLGGGIGEVVSYAVAHTIVAHVEDLEKSALFRWTKATIERRPVFIPAFVWLASATPVPDLSIIVPLAMIKYPWKKMVIPMITGKMFQNIVVAVLFRYAADRVKGMISTNVNFDMSAVLLVIFVMIIAYQIERARNNMASSRNGRKSDSLSDDTSPKPPSDNGTRQPESHDDRIVIDPH